MKIAIIVSDDSWENTEILNEAKNQGWQAEIIYIKDLLIEVTDNQLIITYKDDQDYFFQFDAYLIRGTKGFRQYALPILRYLSKRGKLVISENFAKGRIISDELDAYERLVDSDIPLIPTYYPINQQTAEKVLDILSPPYVLKDFSSSKGQGVKKFENKKEALAFLKKKEYRDWIIQKFIDFDHDLRIYVVGYQALGSMERIPQNKSEFRANISLGAKGAVFQPSETILKAAEKAARLTENEICGVDFIVKADNFYLIEVNRNAQFQGFMKATNVNVPKKIVSYIENKFNSKK